MDSKKQPTFAFNNNMKVKSLNVGLNATEESSDFNVCDDIDELMSSIPAPTTQRKQTKDVEIGNDTKQRGQEDFVLDLRSNDVKRPKVQIEERTDRVLTEKDINILLNGDKLEKEKPADFSPADKGIIERHVDKQIVTDKRDRPTDLYKMFDLKLPKRMSIPNLSIFGTEKILDHKPIAHSYGNASRIETLKQLVENIQNDIDAQQNKETELTKELDHAKSEILKLKEEQKRSKISFYDALKDSVKKKSLLTQLDRHKYSINETANELAHVKSIVNLIRELQTSEIDVMKEKLETNINQRQKLMEEQITNNRRMQDEIDRYKGKANEECARRVDLDKHCKELEIRNKEYQEQIKTLEMEKNKNVNEIKDITEKLLYTDDRCKKLDKNLSECKKRIEINEEENKQIILINRNLNKEIRDQQETAKIVVEKENDLQNMKLELEKTKAELEYVKNDLCDKNAAIIDLKTSKTQLKESCARKMIDKKHQLMTRMTVLANLSNDCSDLVSKLSTYKQKNLAENLSKYYQRVFDAECNKYKKDKQSFLTRISDLKVENKKLKKMNKIMATKGVNPDDNDLWNVFN